MSATWAPGIDEARFAKAPFEDLLRETLLTFFAADDGAFVKAITDGLTFTELAAGERLFRQGDISDDVYFLLNGRLQAVIENGPDAPRVVGEIMRGETVGELAFITREPRSASIVALRGSVLAKMSRGRFERTIAVHPMIAVNVMRIVVKRFQTAQRTRRQSKRPVSICLLAVTDGVDLAAFTRSLVRSRADYGGPVTALTHRDAGQRFTSAEIESPEGALNVSRWIDSVEVEHRALFLVADPTASQWSRHCVAHADEILLVARAEAAPNLSEIEHAIFDGHPSAFKTRRTLLLLHRPETRSPTGTARWLAPRDVTRHIHVRRDDDRHMRRLARLLSGRGVGIVLSGGAARGLAHIGVLQTLADAGIEPDVIGGTSIGSVMGAWQCMEVRGAALAEAARQTFVAGGNPVGDYNAFPFVSLVSGRRVRRLTEETIRLTAGTAIDIEDTWVTFFCVAANYSTSAQAVLTRGLLSKALLASFAIPGILPPIVLDGHLHVDGGAINNLPVDVMETYGLSRIIAVDLLAQKVGTVDYDWIPTTRSLVLQRLKGITMRRRSVPSITEILLKAGTLNSMVRQREMRSRADLCIAPHLPKVGFLDWSKQDIAIKGGAEAARACLASLDAATLASFT